MWIASLKLIDDKPSSSPLFAGFHPPLAPYRPVGACPAFRDPLAARARMLAPAAPRSSHPGQTTSKAGPLNDTHMTAPALTVGETGDRTNATGGSGQGTLGKDSYLFCILQGSEEGPARLVHEYHVHAAMKLYITALTRPSRGHEENYYAA